MTRTFEGTIPLTDDLRTPFSLHANSSTAVGVGEDATSVDLTRITFATTALVGRLAMDGPTVRSLVLPTSHEGTSVGDLPGYPPRWPLALNAGSHRYSTLVNMLLVERPINVLGCEYDPNNGSIEVERFAPPADRGSGVVNLRSYRLGLHDVRYPDDHERAGEIVRTVSVDYRATPSVLLETNPDSSRFDPTEIATTLTTTIEADLVALSSYMRTHPHRTHGLPNLFASPTLQKVYNNWVVRGR